ncbi:hypothetical protein ACFL4N_04210 [Thermodesulfobacteriota bacterium]
MVMFSVKGFPFRTGNFLKIAILILAFLALGWPGTSPAFEIKQARLNQWYDVRTPGTPVNWSAMPKMFRTNVRKSEPYVTIYRFQLSKGQKYTFQSEHPADYIQGSACLRGVNPLAESDGYNQPSGTTGLILCHNRAFPGGNIKGYVFGRKSNFTVSTRSQHNNAYLVLTSKKPRAPFRFQMIHPAENDNYIRKKGGYKIMPNREPSLSWSNVYKKHFWLGYARGEEKKAQTGSTAAVTSRGSVSSGIKVVPGKGMYSPDEKIVVQFSGLPGNQQDWITIVRKGTPANKYGEWFYTKSRKTGSLQFKGLRPGAYEIRVYLNWPSGGYNIVSRRPINVGSASSSPSTVQANLNGQWELLKQKGKPYVWMNLTQAGNRISGRARYEKGSAAVKGIVIGDRLKLDLVYDNAEVLELWLPPKVCPQAIGVSSTLDVDLKTDPSAYRGTFYGFWVRWDSSKNITQKFDGRSPEALKMSKSSPRVLRRSGAVPDGGGQPPAITPDRNARPQEVGAQPSDQVTPRGDAGSSGCEDRARAFLEAVRAQNYKQALAATTGGFQAQAGEQGLTRFRQSLIAFGQYRVASDICSEEPDGTIEAILVLKNKRGQKVMVQFAFIKDRIDKCIARWGVQ